jgi:hypothetical protein
VIRNMDNETLKSVVTRISANHGNESGIESDVVSDDPRVYQSRLYFLRDFIEGWTLCDILIADAVNPLCVRWN